MFLVILNFLQISHMIKSCQYQNFISNLLHFYPGHIGQQWKSPKSQLSLFFFQFSWYLFLVRTGSVGGSGLLFSGNFEGVRYPKKNSQISSSFLSWTQERFQVLLISDHIKTFLHLPVIHSCCRILQYFMIMIFIQTPNYRSDGGGKVRFYILARAGFFWGETAQLGAGQGIENFCPIFLSAEPSPNSQNCSQRYLYLDKSA